MEHAQNKAFTLPQLEFPAPYKNKRTHLTRYTLSTLHTAVSILSADLFSSLVQAQVLFKLTWVHTSVAETGRLSQHLFIANAFFSTLYLWFYL